MFFVNNLNSIFIGERDIMLLHNVSMEPEIEDTAIFADDDDAVFASDDDAIFADQ